MAEIELTEEKQKARAMWAAGDYTAAEEKIKEMGAHTVERAEIATGETVLDIGCGPGNAAIPAASRGARVTGLDLTPELLEAGRRAADTAGVEIDWVEGDAEALPFEDDSFDVVISTVGIMFAPDHRRAAAEAARVLRPGGRLAIASWRPEGSTGRFFATIVKHQPPAPGVEPPILWGTADHVRELFAGTGVDLRFEEAAITFDFDSADAAIEMYEEKFGPVVTARRNLEADGKWEALRADMRAFFAKEIEDAGGGYPGEYLLALGTKAG